MSKITPPFLSRSPPPLDDSASDFDIETPIKSTDSQVEENLEERSQFHDEPEHPIELEHFEEPKHHDESEFPAEIEVVAIVIDSQELKVEPQHHDDLVPPEHPVAQLKDRIAEPADQMAQAEHYTTQPEDHFVPVPDEEDDFGAFEEAGNNVIDSQDQDLEWSANFDQSETADVQEPSNSNQDIDWAADFDQTAAADPQAPSNSERPIEFNEQAVDVVPEDHEKLCLASLKEEMDQTLKSSFDDVSRDHFDESRRENLYIGLGEADDESCDTNCDKKISYDHHIDHSKLWRSLRLIEESLALKFIFADSASFRRYAASLKVDVNLAKLRRPNLPAFAWHLGSTALTPEKPVDPLRPSDVQAKSTVDDHSKENLNSQFQWNSSGISNPLADGSINYGVLDLDYLVGDSQASSTLSQKKISSGDDKSLQFDNHSNFELENHSIPTNQFNTNNKGAHNTFLTQQSVIKKFDSNSNMNSMNTSKKEMSCESVNIVGHLPDLSFMLSPVLMFPVRDYGSDTN